MAKLTTLVRALRHPSSPQAFAAGMRAFRAFFRPRYPFHWPELDWIEDRRFWDLLARYGEGDGLNAHRRKLLYECARHAIRHSEGDTAECGCFMGLGSHLICLAHVDVALARERRHFVFDSFEGLSAPGEFDGGYWSKGDLACDEMSVRGNLEEFDFVEYKKGWIPTRFSEMRDKHFCFVHVDVDLADPTLQCLEFFFPRLSPRGVMILDDYGFGSCPGVTRAVEQFIGRNTHASLLASPVGGGILFNMNQLSSV
jgi:O-methyltransferase